MFQLLSLILAPIVWIAGFLTAFTVRLAVELIAWAVPQIFKALGAVLRNGWAAWRARQAASTVAASKPSPHPQTRSETPPPSQSRPKSRQPVEDAVILDEAPAVRVETARSAPEAEYASSLIPQTIEALRGPLANLPPASLRLPSTDNRVYVIVGRRMRRLEKERA